MSFNNSINNFDALLHKNIHGFRKRIYNIENYLIKCMTNRMNIVNGPMFIRALYCVQR